MPIPTQARLPVEEGVLNALCSMVGKGEACGLQPYRPNQHTGNALPVASGASRGDQGANLSRGGRHIAQDDALDHVFGYTVFNSGSIRDYPLRKPLGTVGKNFDSTDAFGPWLVTADELPPRATGLSLGRRLNGVVMQRASTSDMIFGVAQTIALLSEAMTLNAGDVIMMGSPSGGGYARQSPVYMKAGMCARSNALDVAQRRGRRKVIVRR